MAATAQKLISELRAYFATRSGVSMAFLFGSRARGASTVESDLDVAVYLSPLGRALEIEEDPEAGRSPERDRQTVEEIWNAVEHIAGTETDLVVLNTAPATLAAAALKHGIPLLVRDRELYLRFLLAVEAIAEEYGAFVDDFAAIKARSRSLTRLDRNRLERLLDALAAELAEAGSFAALSRDAYATRGSLRRDVERWTEIIVSASIDLAKVVLASEGRRMPETYREALVELATVPGFPPDEVREAARNARLRNLIAHEYLDLRYPEIHRFVDRAPSLYGSILQAARAWIRAQPPAEAT